MMYTKMFCTIIIACLVGCFAAAFPVQASMLAMKDGTVLVGEIQAEPLTIHTRYGVLTIPASDIARIVEGKIWLLNDSHFSGEIASQKITIKTEFGDLEVEFEQIEWMNFVKNEKPGNE